MAVTALVLALAGCTYLPALPAVFQTTPGAATPSLLALSPTACRALLRDDAPAESLQQAAVRSLEHGGAARAFDLFGRRVTTADMRRVLNGVVAAAGGVDGWAAQLCDRFVVYRVAHPRRLLVTGYYEPELAARRAPTARFRYPLYRTPDDLVDVPLAPFCPACAGRFAEGRVRNGTLIPYYTRAEIDAGALAGKGCELAWLDDPVEAFFLHVQGSALLRFSDGVHLQVSYSSSNGRPYTSLGRVLVEQGKLAPEAVSLQSLKNYLRAHADEQAALMAANQHYVFFRAVATGPIGSSGVPLTAGRSVAADATVYPRGALAFLRIFPRPAAAPGGGAAPAAPQVSRFVVVQDTGTAISGPGRIDVFWGTGPTAGTLAGDLHNPGELYLVLPQ